MNDSGDVFTTLRWGLRRYAWMVVLLVVALAVLVPALLDRVPDRYETQAQVGPTGAINLPNLDPLPRLGTTVFNNGAVADAVRESVDPPMPRSVKVIPERVDLVAAQDNIVFVVVGRGATPESAEHVANVAAAEFTEELNRYADSVGSFAIQHLAEAPTQPVGGLTGPVSIGIGLLAGLAAGVGAVALLLVLRRPVLDIGAAEEVARAAVLGRIQLTNAHGGFQGLPRLARRIQSGAADALLLAGPRNTRRARRLLPRALDAVLDRPSIVVPEGSRTPVGYEPSGRDSEAPAQPRLVIFVGASQAQITTRPERALTLLVVREGIAQASLRRQVEQFLDDGSCGVVLVRGPGWGMRAWQRRQEPVSGPAAERTHPTVVSNDSPAVWFARD